MLPPRLDAYVERLRQIPFVRGVTVAKREVAVGKTTVDALLSIKTPTKREPIYVEIKTSNMSNALAARLIALGRRVKPLLVGSPVIGRGTGELLAKHSISFVDMRGNCHLDLGGRYIASIQGRSGDRAPSSRALRAPSYQVLFALLADPSLLSATVRTLATEAGVSRQPAMTLRARLEELGLIAQTKAGYAWAPQGRRRALDLWLAGYATTVRPNLLVGTYRTQDASAKALESRVTPILDKGGVWRWGGGAAAQRLTRSYRGEKTIIHIDHAPADLPKRLRAVPDHDGPLVILRSPGPIALNGATRDTAHPLLVYSELLAEGSERARDAAERVAKRLSSGRGS